MQDFVVKNLALVAVFGSMSLRLGDEHIESHTIWFQYMPKPLPFCVHVGSRFLLCFAERCGSPAYTWRQASEGAPPIEKIGQVSSRLPEASIDPKQTPMVLP